MKPLLLRGCEGLDTRLTWDVRDYFAFNASNNVQILPGGAISCRPALILDNALSASSFGLYDRGGFLRCVVPSGLSLQLTAPTGVIYDPIGQGGSFDYTGKIGSVLVAETFGTSPVFGPHGYVSIRRSDDNLIEHHWVQEPPPNAASFTNTFVSLPFTPGRAMTKVADKIVASNPSQGRFNYCSTLSGPADWTTPGDAGFEAALQFVSGSREMVAMSIHRGLLAVFYEDAVQLWQMDQDPENIALLQVLNGPGTAFPNSVSNIAGDTHFLGPAGFSNLTTATVTAEATYGSIGDPIRTLTDLIASGANPISIWSQRRSQWLIAVGTTIYCRSIYPLSKEAAWTTWAMPVTVDYMTELNGIVYIRSGNNYYHLDDTIGRDSGASADIAWSWESRQFGWGNSIAQLKALKEIVPQCSARATWTPIVDGRILTSAAVTIPGSASPIRAFLTGSGRRIAISCVGNGLMRTDGVLLGAEVCGI